MTVTHAVQTAKDNSEMHDVSASAWNRDHVVTGLPVGGDLTPTIDDNFDIGENTTPLEWKDIYIDGVGYFDALQMQGNLEILDTFSIQTGNNDADYILFRARDTGVGLVEVGRVVGEADPYVSFGGNQEFRFYNSGYFLCNDNVVITADLIIADTDIIRTSSGDDDHFVIQAKDNGVGLVEVARVVSAAEPHFRTSRHGRTLQTTTLGVGVTTLALTADIVTLTGDGGGNNLATITAGVSGQTLIFICTDALVTFVNDDGHGANTIDLVGAGNLVSADDTTLTLVFDGTSWYETSRSVN